jgi:hypothetical protein
LIFIEDTQASGMRLAAAPAGMIASGLMPSPPNWPAVDAYSTLAVARASLLPDFWSSAGYT